MPIWDDHFVDKREHPFSGYRRAFACGQYRPLHAVLRLKHWMGIWCWWYSSTDAVRGEITLTPQRSTARWPFEKRVEGMNALSLSHQMGNDTVDVSSTSSLFSIYFVRSVLGLGELCLKLFSVVWCPLACTATRTVIFSSKLWPQSKRWSQHAHNSRTTRCYALSALFCRWADPGKSLQRSSSSPLISWLATKPTQTAHSSSVPHAALVVALGTSFTHVCQLTSTKLNQRAGED